MYKLFIAAAIALAVSVSATASDKSDVMATLARWADAFNHGNFATGGTPCADDAVVIDDLPPHVWQGPSACSRWYQAVKAWADRSSVTNIAITIGNARHLEIDAGRAYFVAPVTLSYTKAAKQINFPGLITLTLHHNASGWQVSGMAWADR